MWSEEIPQLFSISDSATLIKFFAQVYFQWTGSRSHLGKIRQQGHNSKYSTGISVRYARRNAKGCVQRNLVQVGRTSEFTLAHEQIQATAGLKIQIAFRQVWRKLQQKQLNQPVCYQDPTVWPMHFLFLWPACCTFGVAEVMIHKIHKYNKLRQQQWS